MIMLRQMNAAPKRTAYVFQHDDDTFLIQWTANVSVLGSLEGLDVEASLNAFVEAAAEALVHEYPDATVDVVLDPSWDGDRRVAVTPLVGVDAANLPELEGAAAFTVGAMNLLVAERLWQRVPESTALALFDEGLAKTQLARARAANEAPVDYADKFDATRRDHFNEAWEHARRGSAAQCAYHCLRGA